MKRAWIATIGGLAAMASTTAAGQAPAADYSKIPVRAAAAQPLVGEEVLDQTGVVASPQFVENRICTVRGCRVFIFDARSGALILNDGQWAPAYAPTGRERQVIRVKDFTPDEYPQAAPDDTALETAPAIVKVTRPSPPKAE